LVISFDKLVQLGLFFQKKNHFNFSHFQFQDPLNEYKGTWTAQVSLKDKVVNVTDVTNVFWIPKEISVDLKVTL